MRFVPRAVHTRAPPHARPPRTGAVRVLRDARENGRAGHETHHKCKQLRPGGNSTFAAEGAALQGKSGPKMAKMAKFCTFVRFWPDLARFTPKQSPGANRTQIRPFGAISAIFAQTGPNWAILGHLGPFGTLGDDPRHSPEPADIPLFWAVLSDLRAFLSDFTRFSAVFARLGVKSPLSHGRPAGHHPTSFPEVLGVSRRRRRRENFDFQVGD